MHPNILEFRMIELMGFQWALSESLSGVPLGIDSANCCHVDHIAYTVAALQHVRGFGKSL